MGTRDSLIYSLAALADLDEHAALGYALEQAMQVLQASGAAAWARRDGQFNLLMALPDSGDAIHLPEEPGVYATETGTMAVISGMQDRVRWALMWPEAPEAKVKVIEEARRANALIAQTVDRYQITERSKAPSIYSEYDTPDILIEYILRSIAELIPCNVLAIYNYRQELNHIRCNAMVSDRKQTPEITTAIENLLRERFLQQDTAQLLVPPPVPGFDSALVIPLTMPNEVLGMLVLLAEHPKPLSLHHADTIRSLASLARMVLENLRLYDALTEELVAAQSILMTARAITVEPSPQNMINTLRDYLFDEHVTNCAMLLYGPMKLEQPEAPHEYLELVGSWSQAHGSGAHNGLKIPLELLPSSAVGRLKGPEILEVRDRQQLHDWIEGMDYDALRPNQLGSIESCVVIPLRDQGRDLGLLFVGSSKPNMFTPPELRSYRMVSEFLSVILTSRDLQKQHAFVQTGRAALLESINDGIVMLTPNNEKAEWRVLTVNRLFCEMFGLPDATQGTSLGVLIDRMVLPDTVRASLTEAWTTFSFDDDRQVSDEFRMIHPEGRPVDVYWFSAPVYHNVYDSNEKGVLGRIISFHDVTAERTAIRVRSDFLGRVSHELRTPLTSIRGFAEFILEAVGDDLPDLAREYLNIILKSAAHLNIVFTDMLEITRADAGELKLKMSDAHLPDVIIDVVARLEFQFKAREQDPVMDLDDDLPIVHMDVDRITQVLTNLVSNAIKYAPEKTQIRVVTRLVESQAELPPSAPKETWTPCILITVSDHGKGLSDEEAKRVFEPFYRSKAARESRTEGAGLGLAVSRSIIELHRGAIWAEARNKAHKGGRFHFTLPIRRPL